jgi:hypothetical protein
MMSRTFTAQHPMAEVMPCPIGDIPDAQRVGVAVSAYSTSEFGIDRGAKVSDNSVGEGNVSGTSDCALRHTQGAPSRSRRERRGSVSSKNAAEGGGAAWGWGRLQSAPPTFGELGRSMAEARPPRVRPRRRNPAAAFFPRGRAWRTRRSHPPCPRRLQLAKKYERAISAPHPAAAIRRRTRERARPHPHPPPCS